jgi:hypothetical protein
MRKFIIPMAIAAMLAPSLALAAVQTTEGTIRSIDAKAMTFVFSDGQTYHLPAGYNVASLKVGEKLKVTWDKMGALNEATLIVIE